MLRLLRQMIHKTVLCSPDLHPSENHRSHRNLQQQWETSAGSMEMSIKTPQNPTPSRTRTTSEELCRWNMWLLDPKPNVEKPQLRLLQRHLDQEVELVQEAKVQWKFLQTSQRGESSQQKSHCLKLPMLNIKADGHRALVNNKAWLLHPALDENHLDLFLMLTTFQHMLLPLSRLPDRILVAR